MIKDLILIKILDKKKNEGDKGYADYIFNIRNSYKKSKKYIYPVQDNDIAIVNEINDEHEVIIAFIVYEKDKKNEVKFTEIFISNEAEIKIKSENKLVINYLVKKRIENQIAIHNFIASTSLDVKTDFQDFSYISIEKSEKLIEQIEYLILTEDIKMEKCTDTRYEDISYDISLNVLAQKNSNCTRDYKSLECNDYRSEFQRDSDRIVHSKAYRRLVDKAQIFTASKGDHYRRRLTHTLEVAQIAKTIAKSLELNIELAEAIAQSHDIGHTPFGHQGERTLDCILKGEFPKILDIDDFEEKNPYGGFKHNCHGLRVITLLEEKFIDFEGLNLSHQVLEGILKHTTFIPYNCENCEKNTNENCNMKCYKISDFYRGDVEKLYLETSFPTTLEGQIVSIADEIAQRSHDLDDAFASENLTLEDFSDILKINKLRNIKASINFDIENDFNLNYRVYLNKLELVQSRLVYEIQNYFVNDVIRSSKEKMKAFIDEEAENCEFYKNEHRFKEKLINFSGYGKKACDYLERIISSKVINSLEVARFDNKAEMIIKDLFKAYYDKPLLLHKGTLNHLANELMKIDKHNVLFSNGDIVWIKKEIKDLKNDKDKKRILARCIADFIAGMTDQYAIDEHRRIYYGDL